MADKTTETISNHSTVFWARIIPETGTYEVDELRIRTVADTYFVGSEKYTRQAFLFPHSDYGKVVFQDRETALKLVKEAEKYKKSFEIDEDMDDG